MHFSGKLITQSHILVTTQQLQNKIPTGLFATIKRCPTRHTYMAASYKQGSEAFCVPHNVPQDGSIHSESPSNNKWNNPRSNSKPTR
ncbi:hypothetical protein CEXT_771881 [Caerostris extrusa]|uniref:Uncharacterized protein n=1 Tax=Caerostris extrusa TaxID=172846 RepID=A0AAV4NEE0_CAEEX|nr:hypothetical protein CEXT_771881 [Caerostris extrusa]